MRTIESVINELKSFGFKQHTTARADRPTDLFAYRIFRNYHDPSKILFVAFCYLSGHWMLRYNFLNECFYRVDFHRGLIKVEDTLTISDMVLLYANI